VVIYIYQYTTTHWGPAESQLSQQPGTAQLQATASARRRRAATGKRVKNPAEGALKRYERWEPLEKPHSSKKMESPRKADG
jgi:hypothetical protein